MLRRRVPAHLVEPTAVPATAAPQDPMKMIQALLAQSYGSEDAGELETPPPPQKVDYPMAELMVMMNRFIKGRRTGKTPVREMKCVNCGQGGHPSSKCPQGRVEPGKQPCFICGKPGCRASTCPQNTNKNRGAPRKGAGANLMDEIGRASCRERV